MKFSQLLEFKFCHKTRDIWNCLNCKKVIKTFSVLFLKNVGAKCYHGKIAFQFVIVTSDVDSMAIRDPN